MREDVLFIIISVGPVTRSVAKHELVFLILYIFRPEVDSKLCILGENGDKNTLFLNSLIYLTINVSQFIEIQPYPSNYF